MNKTGYIKVEPLDIKLDQHIVSTSEDDNNSNNEEVQIMETKSKRCRGSNFTKEEELLLLLEIEKYKDRVECKLTDKVNTAEKNEAWKKILSGFNAKNYCNRSVDQIKIKYDNLKCKARRMSALNKKYIKNGPAANYEFDPIVESVLRIMNKTTVIGLHNPYDDDNSTHTEDEIYDDNAQVATIVPEVIMTENLSGQASEKKMHFTLDDIDNILDEVTSQQKEDAEIIDTPMQDSTENVRNATKRTKTSSWSKYSPKKLRTPMVIKSRNMIRNPIKQLYYTRRAELVEELIKKCKLEQEELRQKFERDSAEHSKKMRLMNLEIKLKEKELM